jgi:hypothetical protein
MKKTRKKRKRKVMELNPTWKRSKECPKNRWRNELLNDSRKLNMKIWIYLVEDGKA